MPATDAPGWRVELHGAAQVMVVTTHGAFTLEAFKAMVGEVMAQADAAGCTRFVFDDREMRPRLTTSEIYALPGVFERLGWTRGMRVAVVYADKAKAAKDFEFFANIAIQRAFAYRLFDEFETAYAWAADAGP